MATTSELATASDREGRLVGGIGVGAPLGRLGGQRWAARWRRARPARLALLIVLGLVTVVPIAYLIINSFNIAPPTSLTFRFGFENWVTAYTDSGTLHSIWTTLWLAVVRTALAVPAAVLLSWLIARTNMPGAAILELGMWVAFTLPTLSLVLGWILLLDPKDGLINNALAGLPFGKHLVLNIYSYWGIIWVHLVSRAIPIQVILMTPAFRRVGARLEEVSRMCGGSKLTTLWRVTAPVIAPAILPLAMLSFISALQSIDIELVLGIPARIYVYSTWIYNILQDTPPQYGVATALGAAVLVVLLGLVLIYGRFLNRREYTTVGSDFTSTPVDLGRFRWPACALCMGFLAVGIGIPSAAAMMGSVMRRFGFFNIPHPFTSQYWTDVLHDPIFNLSVRNSIVLGFGSAVLGIMLYAWAAHATLRSRGALRQVFNLFTWLPRGVPGVLISLAMLWLFLTTPLHVVFYGTMLGLIVAMVVGGLTTGVLLASSALIQIGPELEDASKMCGAAGPRTAVRVLLPLMSPMLLTIGTLVFLNSISEFSQIILIYAPSSRPLSILTLEYLFNGDLERAAVLGVLMTVAVAVVALGARSLGLKLGPR